MNSALSKRIKQSSFESEHQEAMVSVLVAADFLNSQMQAICEKQNITATQYNVLRILKGVHPEGHPRCEIIARMIQQTPDVTRLINRLEAAGFAQRVKSTDDARLSITVITKKGLALLGKLTPAVQQLDIEMKKSLTKAQAQILTNLCAEIYSK